MKSGIKRKVTVLVSCIMLVSALCGCSSNKKESKNISIDVNDMAKQIVDGGNFSDELSKLDEDLFASLYPDIDMDLINKECAYVGTGATAEQVVVLEVKDSDSLSKAKEGIQAKLDDDIEQNEDYLPNEIPKLKSPVLETEGNYIILAVSNDNGKIEKIIDEESK